MVVIRTRCRVKIGGCIVHKMEDDYSPVHWDRSITIVGACWKVGTTRDGVYGSAVWWGEGRMYGQSGSTYSFTETCEAG